MSSAQPDADYIRDLFNRIAPVYDDLNRSLSWGLHRVWKQMAVQWSNACPGMVCLDVCCGSGDLALLLAQQVGSTGQVTGVDFANSQLEIARQRAQALGLSSCLHWLQADALALPFHPDSFDAVTMGYGLRNLTDQALGLKELCRVLKPGAKAAILDFHHPEHPWVQQFQGWYLDNWVIPTAEAHGLTTEYAYIGPSLERFPSGSAQVELATAAGFRHAVHYPIAAGLMGVLLVTK